jgi:hypothetical protein
VTPFFITDGQTLLLILVLLYLSECVIWMKRQSIAFVPLSKRRWRMAFPHPWLGNANGGILFLNPLLPAGRVFLTHLSPISISPSGICAYNLQTLPSGARSQSQTGRFLPFGKITSAGQDGLYLLVNKEQFAKCATAKQARELASLISAMANASQSKREAMARSWVAKQFAVDEAQTQLRKGEATIRSIKWLSWILFLFLFIAAPVLVTNFGLLALLIPIAIAMVALAVLIALLFYRAHKKLYPADTTERIESLVKMILCPPAALRAADILTRNLLADYSPIVLATVLPGNGEQQFVRAFIFDLQHPLKHEILDKAAANTMTWTAAEQLKICLDEVNSGRYARPEELLAPAEREENSVSYCPRCRCQFVVGNGDCPDCPGVGLVQF